MLSMIQDFLTVTVRTGLLDDSSASTAFVTGNLCLREHAGEDLLTNDLDAVTTASCAGVYVGGRGCPRSPAVVAKNLLLYHELERKRVSSVTLHSVSWTYVDATSFVHVR